MADKKTQTVVLPNDEGLSFEDDYDILSYRPEIRFVEPDPEEGDEPPEETPTIDSFKDRATSARDNLNAVAKLFDALQDKVDLRGKDFVAKVDPVQDAPVLAAMKRRFPDKDPNNVNYQDYKAALNCLSRSAATPPAVTAADIAAGKADPLRTNFGGLENQGGENRPELTSPLSSLKPIDTDAFQKSAVIALFALMLPLLQQQTAQGIAQHIATTPHV